MTFQATRYILDVAVTCPATQAMVRTHNTHMIPAKAAEIKYNAKVRTYRNRNLIPPGVVFEPFIIETGGRLHPKTVDFLDNTFANGSREVKHQIRNLYRAVARALMFAQCNMLARFVQQTSDPHH